MPFGDYKDFADCVAKNKDKDNPKAYCADIERTIEKRRKEKAKGESGFTKRFHFGLDGIPFYNRFTPQNMNAEGDIPLTGTFLDFNPTTNGWFIDPDEEANIVNSTNRAWKPKVRIAHSKEPERTIGEYRQFVAAQDDGCTDADGKPLDRHIDFQAITTPQDAQLRTNIQKGYVADISPGLDAEVFCSVCDKTWGLDDDNKLVKDCEHQDAKGVLRNIIVKEGSIVTEPAFEGRTQFRPNFRMAMNGLFSPDKHEREPVVSRPSEGHANDDRRKQHQGDVSKLTTNSKEKEVEAEASRAKAQALNKAIKTFLAESEAEGEGEGEGQDQDEAARVRALKHLKSLKKFEDELGKLGYFKKAEGDAETVKPMMEGAKPPPPAAPTPDHAEPDEDDMPPTQGMSAEEQATVLKAAKLLADQKKAEVLAQANDILGKQKQRDEVNVLKSARAILEAQKDANAVKAVDIRLATIAEQERVKPKASVEGARIPSSEPNLGKPAAKPINAQDAYKKAFEAEMWTHLKQRFRGQ